MNQERPQEDIPGTDGIEVMPRPDEDEDDSVGNETGEDEIGGTEDDEADDEDEAGGLPAL
jgi:hypothetical protein